MTQINEFSDSTICESLHILKTGLDCAVPMGLAQNDYHYLTYTSLSLCVDTFRRYICNGDRLAPWLGYTNSGTFSKVVQLLSSGINSPSSPSWVRGVGTTVSLIAPLFDLYSESFEMRKRKQLFAHENQLKSSGKVTEQLSSEMHTNLQLETETNPLFEMVERNLHRTIASLRFSDLKPNPKDRAGQTPLHKAVLSKSFEVIDALLKLPKINVDAYDDKEMTPIVYAVTEDARYIVSQLADAGANINFKTQDGYSLLHYAYLLRSVPLLEILTLYPQLEIDAKNSDGETALDMTANDRNIQWGYRLIAAGADPEA